jgi:outer membrane protein OmpA-like peptidoglycan-associated protein
VVVRNKLGLVILGAVLAGLSGCASVPDAVNPVSWYRDITGASKNDDLGTGENQQNLDEGSNEPYPNLGNVPAAPDTQLSKVDRDKLVNALLADRVNAQYSADNLHAGEVTGNVPPPSPPSRNAANAAVTATATPATTPAPTSSSPPSPVAAASPQPPVAAAPKPPAPAPARSPATANAGNPPARLPPRGSQPPPAESSLQSPTIPNLPSGEAATPAPPPPRISPPNQVASAAPPPSTRAPVLHPPTQQAAAPANVPATAPTHHAGVSYRVADVSFAPGSAYLSGALRGTIAEIVKLHNDQGGKIRIVGFGEATGQNAAVAGFTLALDRAQAVAVALTDSGVAAKDISVEAAPVPARGGADAPRAEVYLEQ